MCGFLILTHCGHKHAILNPFVRILLFQILIPQFILETFSRYPQRSKPLT